MNENKHRLAQRRENLILEIAEQRVALAQTVGVLRPSLAIADKGIVVIKFMRSHPFLMLSGGAILLKVLRRHHIGKWFRGGWLALRLIRKLNNKLLA